MRSKLPRLVLLPVVAGVAVFGQASAAHASELAEGTATGSDSSVGAASMISSLTSKYVQSTDASSAVAKPDVAISDVQAATSKAVVAACKSSNAVTDVVYKVNGSVVNKLQGHTKQGDTIEVSFKIANGCDDTTVSLAAYQAPSNTFDANTQDKQVLTDHQSGTFKADGKVHTLKVTLSNCDYQVDFVTGNVLNTLSKDKNYSNPEFNLIQFDNGGTETCVVPPPTPPKEDCPTDAAAVLTSHSYTINGVDGFKDLSSVKAGDNVTVHFTVAEGCEDQVYSLVAYNASQDTYSKDSANSQTIAAKDTGTFGPGEHTLTVTVPDCFYQIDFVRGGVIEHFGPTNSDNYYGDQGRLIDADNGGAACVTPPVTPPPVTPPTDTPPPVPPTEVLGEVITPAPQVEALAYTGSNTMELVALGSALTLMGATMTRASVRMRRNSALVGSR